MATVTISGKVRDDSTNRPLPDVTIKLYDRVPDPSVLRETAETDNNGDYSVTGNVQANNGRGDYTIIVQLNGYESESRNRTVLRDATMNFKLIELL
jgi:5-hydroxyisourate hydrolase-like protein (transthyretin family)